MPLPRVKFKDFFKEKDNQIIASIFIVTGFIICLPLFSRQLPIGDDWEYHLLRIESISEGLLSGQFPVRIDPIFFNGFGYASSLFYPDLFLYLPAFFRILGFNLEVSYKLFIGIVSLTCLFTAYFSGKGITKSKYAAIAITIVFCMSQYRLENIYSRFALGEVQAFMFMPLIVYGLYNFLYEKFDKAWLLIIGFSGLFYCHIISLFIVAIVSVIVSLLRIKHLIKNSYKFKRLFFSILLVLGFTAAFWIPFLEQLGTNPLRLQTNRMMSEYGVSIPHMFAKNFTMTSGSNVPIGISMVLLCFLRILLINVENTEQIKMVDRFLLPGFTLLFLASDLFPWDSLPQFFENIQFPWRFYGLATTFISVAIGIMVKELFEEKTGTFGLVMLLIFMSYSAIGVISDSANYIDISKNRYQYYSNSYPGNGYEYLHRDITSIFDITNAPHQVISNTGDQLAFEQKGVDITVEYLPQNEYINVPLLYYKGYTAYFENEKGNKIPLNIVENNHVIRVNTVTVSEEGIINISYTGTAIQFIACVITLTCLFITFWIQLTRVTKLVVKKVS